MRTHLARTVAVVLFALLIGGCSVAGEPVPEQSTSVPGLDPSASGPIAEPGSTDPATSGALCDPVREQDSGASDTQGSEFHVTVNLTGPTPGVAASSSIEVSGDLNAGAELTVDLQPCQAFSIVVKTGGSVAAQTQLDNSFAVLVDQEFALGMSAPRVVASSVPLTDAEVEPGPQAPVWAAKSQSEGGQLVHTVVLAAHSAPATVTMTVGSSSALAATWATVEGGQSLRVSPSQWGRTGGLTVVEFGWPSVTRLAPDADSSSMKHQFQCHVLGAPTKDSWNLEPWRSDIGLLRFMAKRCNP